MYPQVERFVQLFENESDELEKLYDAIDAKYPGNDSASMSARDVERNIAYRRYRVKRDLAWYELSDIGDPMITWIASNCKEYMTEAAEVLKILPATSAELQKLAKDKSFCTAWDGLVQQAQHAGVYPLGENETREFFDALYWFRNNFGANATYMRQLTEHIQKAVDAGVAKALAVKAAKALAAEDDNAEIDKVDDQELVNA